MVNAFEGNRAETTTMLASLRSFMTAHRLQDVTIVADAGMVSASNQRRSRPPDCRSSSAPGFPTSPTW
jgi:transposase